MDPDIGYDIGYDAWVDVVIISYPISGMISYQISLHYRYRCTTGAQESCPTYQPNESDDGPSDIEIDADDMRDYLDQNIPSTSTANLVPFARFLADLPDWSDYTKACEALPQPLPSSAPPCLSIHEALAIQARDTKDRYRYRVLYRVRCKGR
jgi:hypothetical protein